PTNSTGTPSRRPSSRARSGATPRGSARGDPAVTRRKLPWLSPTRSLPVGASSDRNAGVIWGVMAQDVSTNSPATATVTRGIIAPVAPLHPAHVLPGRRRVLAEMAPDRGRVDVDPAQLDHLVAASLEAPDAAEHAAPRRAGREERGHVVGVEADDRIDAVLEQRRHAHVAGLAVRPR